MAKAKNTPKPAPEVGSEPKEELTKLEYAKIHIAAGLEGQAHMQPDRIADRAHAIAVAVLSKPAESTPDNEIEE